MKVGVHESLLHGKLSHGSDQPVCQPLSASLKEQTGKVMMPGASGLTRLPSPPTLLDRFSYAVGSVSLSARLPPPLLCVAIALQSRKCQNQDGHLACRTKTHHRTMPTLSTPNHLLASANSSMPGSGVNCCSQSGSSWQYEVHSQKSSAVYSPYAAIM
jgi:hypothetical protein